MLTHVRAAGIAAVSLLFFANADTVMTTNGSTLTGTIKTIHQGIVTLTTDYAGDIQIKQEFVARILTDEPVLARNTTNYLDAATSEKLDLSAEAGIPVKTAYRSGDPDPDAPKPPKHWAFSAGVNLNGKSGNTESFGVGLIGDAVYTSGNHLLKLYGRYDYERVDGTLQTKLLNFGEDYEYRLCPMSGVYARNDNLQNEMQNIKWRTYNAAGYSVYLWRNMDEHGNAIDSTLRLRLGLGYEYSMYYEQDGQEDVDEESVSLDSGLWFRQRLCKDTYWNTEITFEPSLENSDHMYARHESRLEFPFFFAGVKQEMGILNEYVSDPGDDKEKVDTFWFIRLRAVW